MKWEYCIEVLGLESAADEDFKMSEAQLNDLGEKGWELVSVLNKMGKEDSWCFAILKRSK